MFSIDLTIIQNRTDGVANQFMENWYEYIILASNAAATYSKSNSSTGRKCPNISSFCCLQSVSKSLCSTVEHNTTHNEKLVDEKLVYSLLE